MWFSGRRNKNSEVSYAGKLSSQGWDTSEVRRNAPHRGWVPQRQGDHSAEQATMLRSALPYNIRRSSRFLRVSTADPARVEPVPAATNWFRRPSLPRPQTSPGGALSHGDVSQCPSPLYPHPPVPGWPRVPIFQTR